MVGANGEDSDTEVDGNQSNNEASVSGAVYVSDTSWPQQAYLKASNSVASILLGASQSVAGDQLAGGALA